jgi:glycerophosphoryl diester phosphodiesterase
VRPFTISPPARVATLTLRRHVWRYAAIVSVVQLVVLALALPLLSRLLDLVLATVDTGAVNLDSLGGIVKSPVTMLLLLLFAAVAVGLIFMELAILTLCAHRHLDGLSVTTRGVATDLRRMARKLAGPSALLLVGYVIFLLPLTNIGVTSEITSDIAIPKFVSGELTKTTSGSILWWTGTAVVLYVGLRLILTMSIFLGSDRSLPGSMADSFRATGWLPWRPATAFVGVAGGVGLCLVASGAIAVAVTAVGSTVLGSESLWWPAISLAFVDLARFVILGLGAAWFTLFLVAWQRDLAQEPDVELRPLATGRRRGIQVAFVVGAVTAVLVEASWVVADLGLVRDPGRTLVVAHRGYTAEAVENTIPSLEDAAAAGADVVEMDVLETLDQQLVVMHDVNLKRLAGVDVDVANVDADEVVGLPLRQAGHTAELPSFAAYAARAEELGIRLLVELKPHGQEALGFAGRVIADFDELEIPESWMIQSLDKGLVEDIEAQRPDLDVGYVVPFNVGRLPATTADFVVVEDWSYSDRLAREGEDAGKPVLVWTVNSPRLIRDYVHRGVDGLITDRVSTAVADRQLAADIESPVGLLLDGIVRTLGPRG